MISIRLSAFVFISLLLSMLLVSCSREGTDLSVPALATVDGERITRTILNAYLSEQGISDPTPEQTGTALDNLIKLYVVSNAAKQDANLQTPELLATLELQQRRVLFEQFATNYVSRFPTSDTELQRQYRETLSGVGNSQYSLASMTFADEQQALTTILALQEGASWDELAEQNNTEVLGWVDLTQLPTDYVGAIRSTKPNQVAPIPLSSPQGWRVIKLLEVREFTPPDFAQVSEGMRRDLNRQKVEARISQLRERAGIVLENVQVE